MTPHQADTRRKNFAWTVRNAGDVSTSDPGRQLAVLMDLRDELQQLNALLGCRNFVGIPATLRDIRDGKPRRIKSRYWRLRARAKAHRRSIAKVRSMRRAA